MSKRWVVLTMVGLIGFERPVLGMDLNSLATHLMRGQKKTSDRKIAVLSFPYHDSKISSGSSIVAERLTTYLVLGRGARVIERRLMEKLLDEKKLSESGVVDEGQVKNVGAVLGVDWIVTGTLIDGDNGITEVNARMIETESGEIISAGRATLDRVWDDKPRPLRVHVDRVAPKEPAGINVEPAMEGHAPDENVERLPSPPGKEFKLSNESFPPGRRNYHPNENPFKNVKKRGTSQSQSEESAYDDSSYLAPGAPASKTSSRPVPTPPSFIDKRLKESYKRMNKTR